MQNNPFGMYPTRFFDYVYTPSKTPASAETAEMLLEKAAAKRARKNEKRLRDHSKV